MPDLVIRNARLAMPEGLKSGEISVEEGVIKKIAVSGIPKGELEIDARDNLVIPGAIDAHVHFHDPSFTERETFRSGSIAAAAGGVTSVIAMPLDTPVLTPDDAKSVIADGRRESIIDFALHAGNATVDSIEKVNLMGSIGIKSFKAFTCPPYLLEYEEMENLMRKVNGISGVTFVHAEDAKVLDEARKKIGKRKDPLAHHEARPNEAEKRAVRATLKKNEDIGGKLHFAHITSRQACSLIKEAKGKRQTVTAETCPQYLVFERSDVEKLGPYLRVNPSIKKKEDRAALWEAISKGTIDMVATDHAPGPREEKEVGWKDIWKAQIGIPGVETMLPIMLSEGVAKGRITLERLVSLLSTKPAQIFGLYPRKGVIREGSDADLVVVDSEERTIRAENLHYKVGWTPYEGMKVKGYPILTISRGEIICDNGQVSGKPKRGKFLLR